MQKIIPHIWYNKEAKQAAELYVRIFPDSAIDSVNTIHDTPSGDCDIVSFHVCGYSFMSISAGPGFPLNPSISLMINFDPSQDPDAKSNLDKAWNALIEGGKALMPLDTYSFSEHYGWVQDKYGLTWQLILTNPKGEKRPALMPSMLFVKDVCGQAQEASDFYMSVFNGAPNKTGESKRGTIMKYPPGMAPEKETNVMFSDFTLSDQWFVAMDSAQDHKFAFNEAVSYIVKCDTQEEIDYYWSKLSAVPESEQCGWLKDTYGVSWQIVPREMDEMMSHGTPEQIERVTKSFLAMKKFNIAELKKAYSLT